MTEKTSLAILAKELYDQFGSVKSRRYYLFTFLYAFTLGSVANFAASFLTELVGREFGVSYAIVSFVIILILLLLLVTRQDLIFGVPKKFHQTFLLIKDHEEASEEVHKLLLSILRSRINENFLIEESNDSILIKKKRIIFKKKICDVTQKKLPEGKTIELTLVYCNDDLGEQFSEDFFDDFYLQLKKQMFTVFIKKDSRPFGKFFVQSRFEVIDKLFEEILKR